MLLPKGSIKYSAFGCRVICYSPNNTKQKRLSMLSSDIFLVLLSCTRTYQSLREFLQNELMRMLLYLVR
jgi:hypothetical protein